MNGDEEEMENAEQLGTFRPRLDPTDPEGVLSWTLLKLLYGRSKTANSRIAPLVKDSPANPYYLMAATEIIFQTTHLSDEQAINLLRDIEGSNLLHLRFCFSRDLGARRQTAEFRKTKNRGALPCNQPLLKRLESSSRYFLWKRKASSLSQL